MIMIITNRTTPPAMEAMTISSVLTSNKLDSVIVILAVLLAECDKVVLNEGCKGVLEGVVALLLAVVAGVVMRTPVVVVVTVEGGVVLTVVMCFVVLEAVVVVTVLIVVARVVVVWVVLAVVVVVAVVLEVRTLHTGWLSPSSVPFTSLKNQTPFQREQPPGAFSKFSSCTLFEGAFGSRAFLAFLHSSNVVTIVCELHACLGF